MQKSHEILNKKNHRPVRKSTMLLRLSIASLLAMLITASLLVFLYWQDQIAEHSGMAAQENVTTLKHIQSSMNNQIYAFVSSSESDQTIQAKSNLDDLFKYELNKAQEFNVIKVKMVESL